jgi:hypothetical protein
MGSRNGFILACLLALTGACRNGTAEVTGLRIVTTWTDVTIDQLEYGVTDQSGKELVAARRLPAQPRMLSSGADVVVYFDDERGGSDVVGAVRGVFQGKVVGLGQGRAHLVARTVAAAHVGLIALPGSKTEAAPCADDGECRSGVCADGVCCAGRCAGACLACNVPGRQGTCAPVPEGVKHPLCADQGPQSCRFDGTCDGRGACRTYPVGTRCAEGRCDGSSITAAGACDGNGRCAMGPVITCAPFSCEQPADGPPRCLSRCTTSDDCVRGRQCIAGSCGTKLDGVACAAASECTSGFCVDGVCCDSACEGACLSCVQPGALGVCRTVAEGVKDPRGRCPDEGPGTCGYTGACNGNGACARFSSGTICQAATCTSNTVLHSAGRCDGTGNCIAGADLTCAPFACAGGACTSSCSKDQDCAPGQACDLTTMSCGKKLQGQPCTMGSECLKGFCVDRVCCESDCQGPCRSCALGQTPGRCTNTPSGAVDPRSACKDLGKAKCDNDGTCDGRGACRKYPPGTVCGPGSCNGTTNIRTLVQTCDGKGTCSSGQMVSCGAYRCNGTVCFSACSSDIQCVPPNTCNAGACTQRGMGAPCSSTMPCLPPFTCTGTTCQLKQGGAACNTDAECGSGHCTEGVCCEAGPCPACQSCKVSMFVGFCHALSAGTPDGRCTTDLPSTCKQDGTCDGAGACHLYSAGTVCEAPSCAGAIRTNPKTCDGAGSCQGNGTTDCTPFTCDPVGNACFMSCNDDTQCCCGNSCRGDNSCR